MIMFLLHRDIGMEETRDEMGGTCSTQGEDDKCVQDFSRQTSRKDIVWETLVVKIILKCVLEELQNGMRTEINRLRIELKDGLLLTQE
jgi:hypothetical protein